VPAACPFSEAARRPARPGAPGNFLSRRASIFFPKLGRKARPARLSESIIFNDDSSDTTSLHAQSEMPTP